VSGKKKSIWDESSFGFQHSNQRNQDEIALHQHAEKINKTLFEISNAVNTALKPVRFDPAADFRSLFYYQRNGEREMMKA